MVKLDFSKFHKIGSDKLTTTLKHPAGHTIRIAHRALHPKVKEQLDALPVHPSTEPLEKGADQEQKQEQMFAKGSRDIQLDQEEGSISKPERKLPHGKGYSQGAMVPKDGHYKVPKGPNTPSDEIPVPHFADGGMPSQQGGPEVARKEMYADGTDDVGGGDAPPPVTVNVDAAGTQPPAQQTPPPPPQPQEPIATQIGKVIGKSLPMLPPFVAARLTGAAVHKIGEEIGNLTQGVQAGAQEGSDTINKAVGIQTPPDASTSAATPAGASSPATDAVATSQAPTDSYAQSIDQEQQAINEGFDTREKGINQLAQAEGRLGAEQAQHLDEQAKYQQNIRNVAVQNMDFANQELNNLINDQKDNHIDPNRYWNNKSTVGQISTGIGLILGGIGGGLLHQENPALKMLNDNINRDIQAQLADQNNKRTMVAAYSELFGNVKEGAEFAKLASQALVEDQLKSAAAKAQSPIAKANAMQALGELQQQKAQSIQQFAVRRAMAQGLGGPNAEQDPASALRRAQALGIVNEQQYAQANKELGMGQEVEKLRGDLLGSFNDLSSKALAGILSPIDRNSALDAFAGRLAKISEGRFNLQESKQQIAALMPAPGEGAQSRRNKLMRLNQLLDGQVNTPTLNGLGLRVPKANVSSSLSPTERSFVEYAKKHPENPRSAAILKRFGSQ